MLDCGARLAVSVPTLREIPYYIKVMLLQGPAGRSSLTAKMTCCIAVSHLIVCMLDVSYCKGGKLYCGRCFGHVFAVNGRMPNDMMSAGTR
jgi:hypothetical protein